SLLGFLPCLCNTPSVAAVQTSGQRRCFCGCALNDGGFLAMSGGAGGEVILVPGKFPKGPSSPFLCCLFADKFHCDWAEQVESCGCDGPYEGLMLRCCAPCFSIPATPDALLRGGI
ncbi:hypothetical protein TraAM80_10122, partial [Trypanosoma rangeli]